MEVWNVFQVDSEYINPNRDGEYYCKSRETPLFSSINFLELVKGIKSRCETKSHRTENLYVHHLEFVDQLNVNHKSCLQNGKRTDGGPFVIWGKLHLLQFIDLRLTTHSNNPELVAYRKQFDDELKEEARIEEEKRVQEGIQSWEKARHPDYFDKKSKVLAWSTIFRAMKVKFPKSEVKDLSEADLNQFLGTVLFRELDKKAPYELRKKCEEYLAQKRYDRYHK